MSFMVVPQPDIITVGVEDDRALTIFFFQPVGIQSGLNSPLLGIDAGFFASTTASGLCASSHKT